MPLPGFAGYRPGIASLAPQATGPRRLSRVPRTTIRTFNAQYAGGFLSARSWNQNAFHGLRRLDNGSAPSWPHPKAGESMTTLAQASLHVADRTIAHAPLRTRPLDHARGHHYRGPRRLPGPDSHRQAALNLSLLYVMSNIPSTSAPEQSRRTSSGGYGERCGALRGCSARVSRLVDLAKLRIGEGEFNLHRGRTASPRSTPENLPGLSTWKAGRRMIPDASAGV
jgi:hypothetical protein